MYLLFSFGDHSQILKEVVKKKKQTSILLLELNDPLLRKAYLEGSTALLHLNKFLINLWQVF